MIILSAVCKQSHAEGCWWTHNWCPWYLWLWNLPGKFLIILVITDMFPILCSCNRILVHQLVVTTVSTFWESSPSRSVLLCVIRAGLPLLFGRFHLMGGVPCIKYELCPCKEVIPFENFVVGLPYSNILLLWTTVSLYRSSMMACVPRYKLCYVP